MSMHTFARKPLSWLKIKENVRKSCDRNGLEELAASLQKHGQQQPIVCLPDGTVIDGHRRALALEIVGLTEVEVVITDRPLTESDIKLIQLMVNIQRESLSDYDQWQALETVRRFNPTWTNATLAEAIGKREDWVTRCLAAGKCHPAV